VCTGNVSDIAGSDCGAVGTVLVPQGSATCNYEGTFTGAQRSTQRSTLTVDAVDGQGHKVLAFGDSMVEITGNGIPSSISVGPDYAVKAVGTPHKFVATVADQDGRPLANVRVGVIYVEDAGDCGCGFSRLTDSSGRALQDVVHAQREPELQVVQILAKRDVLPLPARVEHEGILLWLAAGVGIIGTDGDRATMMYLGVLAVGIIGALIARFKPLGMAVAHAVVGVIALVAQLGQPYKRTAGDPGLTGFFIALFVGSAWLFRQAALNQSEQSTA